MGYNYFWLYLLLVNGIGFIIIFLDKSKARRRYWRIPEKFFFILGVIGGALGVYFGMQFLRHKTQHRSFTYGIPALIIFNLVTVYFLIKVLYLPA